MCCEGFMKRIVPFFLTFAVGLFVASFFVTIAAPKFEFNRGWRKHQQYHRTMEYDNQRLNKENLSLKKQLADKDLQDLNDRNFDLDYAVPSPPTINTPRRR